MTEGGGKNLPSGWSHAPIRSIFELKYGKSLPAEVRESGTVAVYGSSGKVGEHSTALIPGPAVVVGRKGSVGAVHFEPGALWPIDTTYFVNEFDVASPRFTYYQLTFMRLADVEKSTAIPGISRDDVYVRAFLLPPYAEQIRIADALDELLSDLDAGVKALEGVRAKLKQYRAAVLKAAVEGTLTVEWRKADTDVEPALELLKRILAARRQRWEETQLKKYKTAGKQPPKNWKAKYQDPVAPDTDNLPPLPAGWCWASVDQITAESLIGLDRGQQHQRASPPGAVYVKMNNVTMDGRVSFEDVVFVDSQEEGQRYVLKEGDLLFNTRNSAELVGKVGIVKQPPAGAVYNNNLMRLRFDGAGSPAFVCFQMCSTVFRARMERVKKATTSVAAVYAKDLVPLPLALPPVDEQVAIIEAVEAQLSGIDHLEFNLDAKLEGAAALRQSILKAAFEGKLVPQDPNDEPGSELLKRIGAERAEGSRLLKQAKDGLKPARARELLRRGRARTTSTGEGNGLFLDR